MPSYLIGALHGVMLADSLRASVLAGAPRILLLRLMPGGAVLGAMLYCAILMSGLWISLPACLALAVHGILLMGMGALAASFLLLARLEAAAATRQRPLPYGSWLAITGDMGNGHWRVPESLGFPGTAHTF